MIYKRSKTFCAVSDDRRLKTAALSASRNVLPLLQVGIGIISLVEASSEQA